MNKLYIALDAAIKFLVSCLILTPLMFANLGLTTYHNDWGKNEPQNLVFDTHGTIVLCLILFLAGFVAWNIARMISYTVNPVHAR